MLGIVVVAALVLTLMWRVYEHRVQSGTGEDGPTVIAAAAAGGIEKITIATV